MAHKIEVASNAAASAWDDRTSVIDRTTIMVGGEAFRAEIGTGSGFNLADDAGSIVLPSHRVVRVTEDATLAVTTMFKGRIVDKQLGRGTRPYGTARQFDVQLRDNNAQMYGIVVDKWSRPAETDYARLLALRNAFLNGAPRASTVLAMTYAPNANTVALPKKVYEATNPAGVFDDLMAQSGKAGFVTVDDEIFYDLETSVAYLASLAITDASPNLTTQFPPMWPGEGEGGEEDGGELYTGATLIKTNNKRISAVRAAVETAHDHWRTTIYDDDITQTTSAGALSAFLDERSVEEKRYSCAIKLKDTQADLIKWGQVVTFQANAVGLSVAVNVRVVHLMWERIVGGWIAHLELAYPMKVKKRSDRTTVFHPIKKTTGPMLVSGSLNTEPFAPDVRPVPIAAAAPVLPDEQYPIGSTYSDTVTGKLYRNVADAWTSAVATTDFVGDVLIGQLNSLVQEALANDPQNMMKNGGGERGTVGAQAPDWTYNAGSALVVAEDEHKYGGRSLKIDNPVAANSFSNQQFTVEADVIYVLSGWIKTSAMPVADPGWGAVLNTDINTAGAVTVLELVGDSPATADVGLAATGTPRDWTFVKIRYKFASAGTIIVYCQIGHTGNQSGTAWFDGLRFARESKIVADDITAGAVTTTALNAGAVTAAKLSVGANNGGGVNAVLDGSFEENGTLSWTRHYEEVGAPPASNGEIADATAPSGSKVFQLAVTAATDGSSIASKSFPVNAGDVWYMSCWAKAGAAQADGFFFRILYGLTEDFARFDTGVTANDVFFDAPLTGGYVQKQGYVTVPAGAKWARIALYNYQPSTAGARDFYFDEVIAYRVVSGVKNSDGNVVINAAGIAVTNGKIVVASDGGGTVVIDGTSNMFKIAATGTISKAWGGNGTTGTTTSTLSALGNYAAPPMVMWNVTEDNANGGARVPSWGAAFDNNVPPRMERQYLVWVILHGTSPSNIDVSIYVDNRTSGAIGTTASTRYYVLKEASI